MEPKARRHHLVDHDFVRSPRRWKPTREEQRSVHRTREVWVDRYVELEVADVSDDPCVADEAKWHHSQGAARCFDLGQATRGVEIDSRPGLEADPRHLGILDLRRRVVSIDDRSGSVRCFGNGQRDSEQEPGDERQHEPASSVPPELGAPDEPESGRVSPSVG